MPAFQYTSDIDAAQLTLVRSLENLQKALPGDRRHSEAIYTPAFELNQDLGRTNPVLSPDISAKRRRGGPRISTFRRYQDIWEDDDLNIDDDSYIGGVTPMVECSTTASPSWKRYIRPSEVLALERQMESLHQDMRDLEGARQRRYQESPIRGMSSRQKLRRVSNAVPQRRVISYQNPQSNSLAISRNYLISTDPQVDLMGRYPVACPNNLSRFHPLFNGEQYILDTAKILPHVRKPMETSHPVHSTVLPSDNRLSKPAVRLRPFSTPDLRLPPLVNVSSSLKTTHPGQHKSAKVDGMPYNSKVMNGGSSVSSESGHQNRRSSIAYKTAGTKPQSNGGKKVRFAENIMGVEDCVQAETLGETIGLAHKPSPLPLPSPLPSLSPSQSVSITIASPRKENPGLFDTHSLSSSDGEELEVTAAFISQAPSSTPSPASERKVETRPAMRGSKIRSPMIREGRYRNKSGGLARFFSRKGKGSKATFLEDNFARETSEKINYPGGGLSVAGNESTASFTSSPEPSHLENSNTHRPNTNTPIRSLLRKHSENLLSRLSWGGNKTTITPEIILEEAAESICVVCRDTFDTNSLIQVPEECLHLYCKGCLKTLFTRALQDPHNSFPVKCCGPTTIDLSVASALLSSNKVTRYRELMLEHNTTDKVYCYNRRCNRFIPPANIKGDIAKCRKCRRPTCTHCKKRKHQGVCKEDQESMDAGKDYGWVQCHKCQHLVERTAGCSHITCVCNAEFCYICGKEWSGCKGACTS